MFKIVDRYDTPRFCTVETRALFPDRETAEKYGYNVSTGRDDILGKQIDATTMHFGRIWPEAFA